MQIETDHEAWMGGKATIVIRRRTSSESGCMMMERYQDGDHVLVGGGCLLAMYFGKWDLQDRGCARPLIHLIQPFDAQGTSYDDDGIVASKAQQ
ncbi:hypothetical protein C8034_v001442 [Colletotrichum sidae]|uniref:Uncharacterized protein n=1 Tax=Colletotrichum sidae TaxID=1347389 RepID=A0A4R8TEE6_9PEZI|nr:hypothetical protein C8034_v001442 [Colletotrichum sidae]